MLLKVYLDDKVVELSAIQNQQIREIIQQPIPPQLIKKNVGAKSDLEDGVSFQYVYEFDANNTFMDSIFSGTHVQKFKRFINHKCTIIWGLLVIITLTTLSMIMGIQCICFARADLIIAALWFISQHLLCNKEALKLCLQSFDYWIKVCYSLIWSIDNFVGSSGITNRYFILLLGTSFISVLDASPSKYTMKLVLPFIMAIIFSFISFSSFLSGEADCHGANTISIKSLASSSNRIICLFFWKQAFKTWRHKHRASTLAKSPRIVWIDNTSTAPQVQQNTNTTIHSNKQRIPEIAQSNLKTLAEGPDDRYDDKEETDEQSLSKSTDTASECVLPS
eukprot:185517_1